jgi:hypothetical protein
LPSQGDRSHPDKVPTPTWIYLPEMSMLHFGLATLEKAPSKAIEAAPKAFVTGHFLQSPASARASGEVCSTQVLQDVHEQVIRELTQ